MPEEQMSLISAVDAHCLVCITDGTGSIVRVNDALATAVDGEVDTLAGRPAEHLFAQEHPDISFDEILRQVSSGEIWRGRVQNVTSAGATFWSDVTVVPFIKTSLEETRVVFLLSDASEKMDLENRLAKANQELADMAKIQSNFLAAMSHDLRTPLNSIIGFTDIINQGLFGPIENARYGDYLESVNGSARHLLTLVNDILDFSIMEATGYKFQLERYDPVEQTRTVARTFDWIRREKNLRLDVVRGPNAPDTVLADPRVATQIQTNLIANASRHSPEGGLVRVTWDQDEEGGVFLEVSNEGDPIPDEIIEGFGRLFLIRNPMHASNTEKSYGLGLYICHRFIKARGGKLVISRNNGIGALVRATWPASVLKPESA